MGVGGDVDGDGINDYVLGARSDSAAGGSCSQLDDPSYWYVYSGATHTPIFTFTILQGAPGVVACGHAGWAAAIVGDVVDATGMPGSDGRDEFLLGYPEGSCRSGRADLINGATMTVVRSYIGVTPSDFFGRGVFAAGDLDLDGWPDHGVAGWQPGNGCGGVSYPQGPGYFRVYSGQTGGFIRQFNGSPLDANFAILGIQVIGDENGDGYPDYVVGAPSYSNNLLEQGRIVVVSGLDGTELRSYEGIAAFDRLGAAGCHGVLADLDGDLKAELVGGSFRVDVGGVDSGYVGAFASAPRLHWLDTSVVEGLAGATVKLMVRGPGGAASAGAPYVVLGSLSGTSGGFPIGGQTLPLNPLDLWFQLTLDPFVTPFVGGHGFLDGTGTGQATLTVPGGLGIPGAPILHASAAVIIDPLLGVFVSEAGRLHVF